MWDYARLSKMAASEGGPENLVAKLIASGVETGRREMIPWIGAAAVGGSVVSVATGTAIAYFKNRKIKKELEIEATKLQLINEIRTYERKEEEKENEV